MVSMVSQLNDIRIDETLKKRKILITCGTGGVGKTTLSAAIAIRAALLGRKVVVITIDPAKRLATSLGLQELGNEPTDLTPEIEKIHAAASSLSGQTDNHPMGTLTAIVPDVRKTFEDFVHELAPEKRMADRILENPIFQIFAKEFSGTHEYMALERLLSLSKRGEYDCIILDTPPSRNTLSFLEAPQVLTRFFDEKILRWLVLPANQIMSIGIKKVLGVLERLTGGAFMTHLFEFASAMVDVQIRFSASVRKISELLGSEQVGFLMVTTPTFEILSEASHFIDSLRTRGFHFEGVALNRTLSYLGNGSESGLSSMDLLDPAFQILVRLQEREKKILQTLEKNRIPICAKLPELARDIHSVEDLYHVALSLGRPVYSHLG